MGSARRSSHPLDGPAGLRAPGASLSLGGVDPLEPVPDRKGCAGEIKRSIAQVVVLPIERKARQRRMVILVRREQHALAGCDGCSESRALREREFPRAGLGKTAGSCACVSC